MIIMIDNYDSFTYNLVQYLSMCGREVKVFRNDAKTVDEVLALKPDMVVISPGPGRPEDAGICIELIQRAPADLPVFGVCLGFQAMVSAFGGDVVHAPYLMHGKVSAMLHDGKGAFADLPSPLNATRYHSLMAAPEKLPDCFEISARTQDDLIMGIRHKARRLEGVQFHPESYLTEHGLQMIRNMLV
ncbi:anthranilate synthase component II [Acanthopleuribacter pedis]|uniref:Aminodeoxychorismate/anthranilate synthase component II n=1 Tax=Acanthopleuribacter pedis TaxID=442870 RepID=A0A8J7Q900_9BACT|nr:aminodeoxychorismate/anthranilate synthase component II [Acanthopleuribacter pedis]MBO1319932.1 aminodeoxychorismate/anthranilate synthase component II [Acanthopleuribacter pedis]